MTVLDKMRLSSKEDHCQIPVTRMILYADQLSSDYSVKQFCLVLCAQCKAEALADVHH